MTVRVSNPFGMVEMGRTFHSTARLTVTPRIVPLPPIPSREPGPGRGQPSRVPRDRECRGRHGPGSTDAATTCVECIAQLGAGRRTDGAPRGAALAVTATVFLDHRASGAHPGRGAGVVVRDGSSGRGLGRGASGGPGLRRTPGDCRGETLADSGWHDDERTSTTPVLGATGSPAHVVAAGAGRRVALRGRRRHADRRGAGRCLGHDRTVLRRMRHGSSASPPWCSTSRDGTRALRRGTRLRPESRGVKAVPLRPGDRIDRAWRQLGNVAAGRRG